MSNNIPSYAFVFFTWRNFTALNTRRIPQHCNVDILLECGNAVGLGTVLQAGSMLVGVMRISH